MLTTGATVSDNVSIIAYGSFDVANTYTQIQSDARFAQLTNNLSDLANAATARTNLGLAIGTDVQAYDADTTKNDVANTFTAAQTFSSSLNKFTLTAPTTAATINTRADNLTHSLPEITGNLTLEQLQQNSKSVAYTTVLADAGKHILHPTADTTARTFTIDSNANVAYVVGTAITFVNQVSAGVVTIAITTDTMRLAGAGTTGSRTLAADGVATALKITSTEWLISGTGLT